MFETSVAHYFAVGHGKGINFIHYFLIAANVRRNSIEIFDDKSFSLSDEELRNIIYQKKLPKNLFYGFNHSFIHRLYYDNHTMKLKY